ncbi:hypothetical protein V5O48_012502 [Marasmius crinis-equi]|uniref:Chromo domain-containing protein n=1 Tax=Marasmius crinis-equi TaxID=585013 RepID=A0ABR3F2Y2_9AGAR
MSTTIPQPMNIDSSMSNDPRDPPHILSQEAHSRFYAVPTHFLHPAPPIEVEDTKWHFSQPIIALNQEELPNILHPNPIHSQPPQFHTYPCSPTYTLRRDDPRFPGGCCYVTAFDPIKKKQEYDNLVSVSAPPGTHPRWDEARQAFDITPIEGMIDMPPGIPFGVAIHDDPRRFVTVGCYHTLDSLRTQLPVESFQKVEHASNRLWDISWGYDGGTPLYALEGMKRNMRSAAPSSADSYDGSYSLASIVEEGRGVGTVSPAVQANSPEAKSRIAAALELVNEIYALVAPLSMSKAEWEITQFRDKEMNIFAAGGLNPGPTSVQENASSSSQGGTLARDIGERQGSWHVDQKDHFARWTLLIIQMRLPPGSDMGAFLLGRPGLYCRADVGSNGEVRVFLLFKGNDIHTGTAPSVSPEARDEFLQKLQETYNRVDETNRCVYVAYPSRIATERTGPIIAAAPTGLGNDLVTSGQDQNLHNFTRDGIPALGSSVPHQTRLAWESYISYYNRMAQSNMFPDFLGTVKTISGTVQIPPPPVDPHRDCDLLASMRSHYRQLYNDALEYYLNMSKAQIRAAGEKATAARHAQRIDQNSVQASASTSSTIPAQNLSTWSASRNLHPLPKEPASAGTPAERIPVASASIQSSFADTPLSSNDAMFGPELRRSGRLQHQSSTRPPTEDDTMAGTPVIPVVPNLQPMPPQRSLCDLSLQNNGSNSVGNSDPDDRERATTRTKKPAPSARQQKPTRPRATTKPRPILPLSSSSPSPPTSPTETTSAEAQEPYEISFILDEDPDDGSFLLRWKDCDSSEDDWKPYDAVSADDLIEEYRASLDDAKVDAARQALKASDEHIAPLNNLFDTSLLQREGETVTELTSRFTREKSGTTQNPVTLLNDSSSLQILARQLDEQDEGTGLFTEIQAEQIIQSLQNAQHTHLASNSSSALARINEYAFNLANSRSLLFIYHWVIIYGPRVADTLFPPSRSTTKTPSSLQPLADHIYAQLLEEKRNSTKASGSYKVPASILPSWITRVSAFSIFELDVPAQGLSRTNEQLKIAFRTAFTEFIAMHTLAVGLRAFDRTHSRAKQTQTHRAILDRCLVRGAILDALLDVLDDDGIFCSPSLIPVLETPWRILGGGNARVEDVARQIRAYSETFLKPITWWMKVQSSRAEVQELGRSMARQVKQCVSEAYQITMSSTRRTIARQTPKRALRGATRLEGAQVGSNEPLRDIFPIVDMPQFGYLAVILREVLAVRRKRRIYSEPLRRILSGEHPTTSTHSRIVQTNHVDPVRATNKAQTLLEHSIASAIANPAATLYSTWGLSNLLVRLGTGQGAVTEVFIKNHLCQWFADPEECVQVFDHVNSVNETIGPFIAISNASCWGQFCDNLGLDTSRKRKGGIRGRIEEFFTEVVQSQWRNFLGDRWENPGASSDLPTFKQALELGVQTKVDGFGAKSLTNLQLANTLALLGICQQPTVDDIAEAAFHLNKGACRALYLLGYHGDHSLPQVRMAFRAIYKWMEISLSDEDKEELRFGPMFLEHLLCKLKRWLDRYPKLDSLRKEGLDHADDFPLPLHVDRTKLYNELVAEYGTDF